MIVAASQSVVITRDQTDAEGLPAASTHTAVLWKNGEATGVSITRTNPATGVYVFAWTIPADAAQYDVWSLRVVDGDGYAATVWEGVTGPITAVLDSAVQEKLDATWKYGDVIEFSDADSGETESHRITTAKIS